MSSAARLPSTGSFVCKRGPRKSSADEKTRGRQTHCQPANGESAHSRCLERLLHLSSIEQHDHLEHVHAWNHDDDWRHRHRQARDIETLIYAKSDEPDEEGSKKSRGRKHHAHIVQSQTQAIRYKCQKTRHENRAQGSVEHHCERAGSNEACHRTHEQREWVRKVKRWLA